MSTRVRFSKTFWKPVSRLWHRCEINVMRKCEEVFQKGFWEVLGFQMLSFCSGKPPRCSWKVLGLQRFFGGFWSTFFVYFWWKGGTYSPFHFFICTFSSSVYLRHYHYVLDSERMEKGKRNYAFLIFTLTLHRVHSCARHTPSPIPVILCDMSQLGQ